MRKICLIFLGLFLCADAFSATARSSNAIIRSDSDTTTARQTTNRSAKNATNRSTVSRSATQQNKTTRSATKTVSARSATARTAIARSTTANKRVSRAATNSVATRTFGNNYVACRDAYFTCMDQFCANQNDTYRRCVCSSRLQQIQDQEKLLSQTSTSLQDFHDFNIDAISKTAAEVKAMQTASAGEQGIKEDKSNSATTLKNIKSVLANSKQSALSTGGTLDIAGDIKSIWKTTDLIRGYDIATLSGEALYNAVNSQCSAIVSEQCSASDLKMIASAYGMYIENDCELLATNVKNKTTNANAAIRTSRHEMQDARLENYDAHNALSINDCIAKVRQDITADTACGTNYVHCLDITGKYLNITTGEPIYSTDFYQLENQLSLSGDVLKNSKNSAFVNALNKKQKFAQISLDACRDVSSNVWDEFLRQALVEIYQGQQGRVQNVKKECLQVVNQCYLNKSEILKDFADDASTIASRQTLELSEELCADKLNTCSNLYGGGPEGLDLLVSTMAKITDTTIAQECPVLLKQYAEEICAVPTNDTLHSYPYGCRTYVPGDAMYASKSECNQELNNPFNKSDILISPVIPYYSCEKKTKKYTSCNFGYFLYGSNTDDYSCPTTIEDNYQFQSYTYQDCCKCPNGYICPGQKQGPIKNEQFSLYANCGDTYIGSLYQKLVRYALQNCTRTTNTNYVLPQAVLSDVQIAMDNIRSALTKELSTECERLNGIWVTTVWQDTDNNGFHDVTDDTLLQSFYITTSANKLWGYCKEQ